MLAVLPFLHAFFNAWRTHGKKEAVFFRGSCLCLLMLVVIKQEEYNMQNKEFICTIDELGRVLVPRELRIAIGWNERDKIVLSRNVDDTLTLRILEKGYPQTR